MKKLIALIGAVATAFGLYAADPDPTNYTANSFDTEDDGVVGDVWTPASPWSTTLDDGFNVLPQVAKENLPYTTEAERRDGSDKQEPNKFQKSNPNFLKLETGTNVLDVAIAAGQIYFDQLVKFTGFEEEPTFADETKIAVWMSAIEQEGDDPEAEDYIAGSTNLYVQVGTGEGSRSVALAVDGITSWEVDTWYRVTIKSLGNVITPGSSVGSQAGFLVFINGKPAAVVDAEDYHSDKNALKADALKYYTEGLLFTSMTTDVTLAKVGYQGIGGIDDVVLSEEAPDFDSTIDIELADFNLPEEVSVDSVWVGDQEILLTDGKYVVKPGDTVRVVFAGVGPYFVAPTEKIFANVDANTDFDVTELIEVIPAIASVSYVDDDEPVVLYYTNFEETVVAVSQYAKDYGSVEVEILQACTSEDENYELNAGTLISIEPNHVWDIDISGCEPAEIVNLFGAEANKQITVEGGLLILDGTVADGAVITAEEIEIDSEVTLVGSGKIVTKADVEDGQIIGEGGAEIEALPGEDDWVTYQIKAEEEDTGFAIIIADNKYKYFPTLQDAIDAAGEGDYVGYTTVVITKDAALDARVAINNKTVTLAADKAVTVSCATDRVLDIRNNANVTIDENVTLTSAKNPTVFVLGTTAAKAEGDETKSTLVVNGTIANTNSEFDKTFALCGNGDDYDGVNITIGAKGVVRNANGAAIYFPNPGALTVNGTVEGYSAIIIKDGTLTVNDGAVITATGANYQVFPRNTNGATPTGDAIIAGYYGEALDYGTPIVNIVGGTISVNPACTDAVGVQGYDSDERVAPDDAKNNIEVAGGTFNAPVAEDYCANGYIPLDNGDGTYGVKVGVYVARVNGEQGYETLAGAFADVEDGDTVTLLDNLTLDAALTINTETTEGITLDLGGKTLTGSVTISGTTLEIANGVIDAANGIDISSSADVTLAENAKVIVACQTGVNVANSTYTVYGTNVLTIGNAGSINAAGGAIINIEDGAVVQTTFDNNSYAICAYEATDVININGGLLTTPNFALEFGPEVTLGFNGGVIDGYVSPYPSIKTPLTDTCLTLFKKIQREDGALKIADLCAAGYEPQAVTGGWMIGAHTYNITFDEGCAAMTYTVKSELPIVLPTPATTEKGEFLGWTNTVYETPVKTLTALPTTLDDIAFLAAFKAEEPEEDWDNPAVDIDETTTADEAWPSLKETDLAKANAGKLKTWATKKKVDFADAAAILPEAFLLNCDNTPAAVEAAKEAFKIPAITVDGDTVTVTQPTGEFNGTIKIMGSTTVDGKYDHEKKAGDQFFKAVLGF